MTVKRTVAVAGLASAVLIGASASFALTSGLFGGRRADQVGSFRPVEMRLTPLTDAQGQSLVETAAPTTADAPPASVEARTAQEVVDDSGGTPALTPSPAAGPNPAPAPAIGTTPRDDTVVDAPDAGANGATEVDDGHQDVEVHAPESEPDDHGRTDDD